MNYSDFETLKIRIDEGVAFVTIDHPPINLFDMTLIGEMDTHLKAHSLALDSDAIRLSPMLELDTKTEQFTGQHADAANQFLKREYREGYEVPSLV